MVVQKIKCALVLFAFLILIAFPVNECKRGGGRRGGAHRGSSNVWGRVKQSQGTHNVDMYGNAQRRAKSPGEGEVKKPEVAADVPKASAPPAPTNQKSSSDTFLQQERKQLSNEQRPIGWDVGQGGKIDGNKNIGWNVGGGNVAQPKTSASNLGNSYGGSYPNTGSSSYYNTGNNYNYGNSHLPNTGATGGTNYNHNGYHPQYNQPQGISGPYPTSNVGGHYSNGYYGAAPMPGQSYGGGFLGGSNYGQQGYGGLGGYGGYGGNGVGGYGNRFGGGFGSGFGKNAVRNVLVGLLVWNLVSGFTSRPYNVYNYYNNPEKVPEEIPVPANTIVLCPQNVTSLCAPNTAALCTSTSTILCVVLAAETVPCGDNTTLKCVKSTANCGTEEACDGGDKKENGTVSVNIPCVTNATIIGKMDDTTVVFSGSMLKQSNSTALCVTTLALPQPEEQTAQGVRPLCSNDDGTPCIANTNQNSTNGTNLDTNTDYKNSTSFPLTMEK